ncbi:MAG: transposase [Bacteroidia bacterium]|nr:transposase [Bacteroidia bacterium]
MYFEEDCTYHIYNRSNEVVFEDRANYIFFLQKVRKHIMPCAHILCYCLMPNHFHFIVKVKKEGAVFFVNNRVNEMQRLTRAFGTVLSSYTQAINTKKKRRGSLFAHKTRAKLLNDTKNDYAFSCFMYVHQNPILAHLVNKRVRRVIRQTLTGAL